MVKPYEGRSKLANRKEELFCQLYADIINGTQAAISAGYGHTYNSSKQLACKLLKKDRIKLRIDYLLEQKAKKLKASKERRMSEASQIAHSDINNVIEISNNGNSFKFSAEKIKENGFLIQEISCSGGKAPKKTIKLYDKLKAMELLERWEDKREQYRLSIAIDNIANNSDLYGNDNIEIEDDGFIESMNDVADNMEDDSFVIENGRDDNEEEESKPVIEEIKEDKKQVEEKIRIKDNAKYF